MLCKASSDSECINHPSPGPSAGNVPPPPTFPTSNQPSTDETFLPSQLHSCPPFGTASWLCSPRLLNSEILALVAAFHRCQSILGSSTSPIMSRPRLKRASHEECGPLLQLTWRRPQSRVSVSNRLLSGRHLSCWCCVGQADRQQIRPWPGLTCQRFKKQHCRTRSRGRRVATNPLVFPPLKVITVFRIIATDLPSLYQPVSTT